MKNPLKNEKTDAIFLNLKIFGTILIKFNDNYNIYFCYTYINTEKTSEKMKKKILKIRQES